MPYVLIRKQKGKTTIYSDTVRKTKGESWAEAGFWRVADKLGRKWREEYWLRERAARNSAKKHGFYAVPCKIVLR